MGALRRTVFSTVRHTVKREVVCLHHDFSSQFQYLLSSYITLSEVLGLSSSSVKWLWCHLYVTLLHGVNGVTDMQRLTSCLAHSNCSINVTETVNLTTTNTTSVVTTKWNGAIWQA